MTMDTALLVYFLAQFADVISTVWGLEVSKGVKEGNGLIARLMGIFGKRWFAAKIILAGVAAFCMEQNGNILGLLLVAALLSGVAVLNVRLAAKRRV